MNVFPYRKWVGAALKNGRLLALAEKEFDVFFTGDRNLSFQQHLSSMKIAVIVLEGKGTQLRDILPLMETVLKILPNIYPGEVRMVS